ncbi:hypothetical protein BDV96DRAFT_684830 [Lophiotrema nucula]|uniref:DNA mismatch repair protein S5 domain-containing protein n=1 Tax=Lophiotrema nucula TaxID=690887 RepID=A0A6A5ZIB5_9PLEO|nr:hypothetical protein BDV96DRAFT_684830 [Lophiotrema nucula]
MTANSDLETTKIAVGIQVLPPTTVRQIGSSQCLVDSSSVVKELIDNALDARATAIFVDMTANTIDSIQVKDTGHGIPTEDRAMVCRRYCTSKIRNFDDLKEVGGTWLGFRGEALASTAEMSGSLAITTRVEGESVASLLKYGRDGEQLSTEKASHPVGTTVRVADFFKSFPVRKQAALKHSAKYLAKIKRLIQAFALARPTVRFQLRILKAKVDKGNFVYAPKIGANVEDAAFKVIGSECAKQCDWTALETDGFEVHAFLPRPDARAMSIANYGAFVSVDARPVSTSHGTLKQIASAFKEKLRKANPDCATIKDPFFCMNIICPPDSYDPNIEPAKDDMLFADGNAVVSAVNKLLTTFYPESTKGANDGLECNRDLQPPMSAQQPSSYGEELSTRVIRPSSAVFEDQFPGDGDSDAESMSATQSKQPKWRSTMYGIDEEDVVLLERNQENQAPLIEEDEGDSRAASISNPWTIAKMNAIVKPKASSNAQLLTPAKGPGDVLMSSSPSAFIASQHKQLPLFQPLTPQSASMSNVMRSPLDEDLERSSQPILPPAQSSPDGSAFDMNHAERSWQHMESSHPGLNDIGSIEGHIPPDPRRSQRRHLATQPSPDLANENDNWFRNATPKRKSNGSQRKQHAQGPPLFPPTDGSFGPRGQVLDAAERLGERLTSKNNTDIRDFLLRRNRQLRSASVDSTPPPSFAPINLQTRSRNLRGDSTELSNSGCNFRALGEREFPRPSSEGSNAYLTRSQIARDNLRRNRGSSATPNDIAAAFREYEERDQPVSRPLSSTAPMNGPSRRTANQRLITAHRGTSAEPHDLGRQFQAYAVTETPAEPPAVKNPLKSKFAAGKQRIVGNAKTHAEPSNNKQPASQDSLYAPPPQPKRKRGRTRTRSFKRALSYIPESHMTKDTIVQIATDTQSIANIMRKLDMSHNALEWGYPAEQADDAFADPVSEGRAYEWCVFLDKRLDEWFERTEGADVVSVLVDGVKRGLADDDVEELMGVV